MQIYYNDIINKKIIKSLQTLWVTIDGISAVDTFILLETNILFMIPYNDGPDKIFPIEINPLIKTEELIPAETPDGSPNCVGAIIQEVYFSDFWHTIGFGLSNGCILRSSDWGPNRVGAFITPKTKKYLEGVNKYTPFK